MTQIGTYATVMPKDLKKTKKEPKLFRLNVKS